jgi:hypothetical protein
MECIWDKGLLGVLSVIMGNMSENLMRVEEGISRWDKG